MQKIILHKPDKWLKIMSIGFLQWLLLFSITFGSYANKIEAQPILTKSISITLSNTSLKLALEEIQQQTGTRFVYSSKIDLKEKVNLNVKGQSLSQVLTQLLNPYGIGYKVVNNNIVLVNTGMQEQATIAPAKLDQNSSNIIQNNLTIRGRVIATSDNSGLPGVSIVVKGTINGTVTDGNGDYELVVNDGNAVLVFSFVGYVSQEIQVGKQSQINVNMIDDSKALEELVVVGYGTQKKVNLTGAVTQIEAKQLENRPLNNMSQILQGMVPNLNITFSTGQPGQGGNLNVRGETSINGGGPLVLIDGVPGDINRLNPADVESVSVLKDAAASAIYGARGAFGVILVTTKTAKSGRTSVSYSNNFGWSNPTISTDFMTNGYDHVRINDEAFKRATGNTYTRYSEEDYEELFKRRNDQVEHPDRPWVVVKNVGGKDIYNYYGNYDWWNTIFNMKQATQQHNLNFSGGNDKMNYYLSGSFFEKDGIMRINTDKFKSYTLRSKINANLTPWLKISNNTQYFNSAYTYPGLEGGANSNFVAITVHAMPAYAPRNPDGTPTYNTLKNNYSIGDGLFANLLKGVAGGQKKVHELTTLNSMTAQITKNWNIVANHSYTLYLTDDWYRAATASYSIQPGILAPVPNYTNDQLKKTMWFEPLSVFNLFSSYNKTLNKHYFGVTAGVNAESKRSQRLQGARKNLLSESLNDLNLGTGEQLASGGSYEYSLFGAFYRLNYDFAGKYLFEVNGRYDGTSRFGEGRRYGFFPSVSAGWRVSEEEFFAPLLGTVNNLKLRASYGTLGNQLPSNSNSSSFYPYISSMSTSLSNWMSGGQKLNYTNSPNPISANLTWEKATTTNFGLDADFFKNRLNLGFDIYVRNTTDMLVPGQVLPAVFGAAVPTQNAGDLQTKGFELTLGWRDQIKVAGKPFNYNASFIVSDSKSKITKYENPNKILSSYYVGQTIGEIWGYAIDSYFRTDEEAQAYQVDQTIVNKQRLSAPGEWSQLQAGDLKFIDLNGDGRIDQGANTLDNHGDRRIIGNNRARYRFGLNLGASWNNFDFSALIQGIWRKNWYPGANADKFWGPYSRPYYSFIPHDFENDIWTPENPDAYFPLLRGYTALNAGGDLNSANDRYLQNVGYGRLKNLVIGYTIPERLSKKVKVPRARLFISGENLLTYTPLRSRYIDPEQIDGDGTNGRTYPLSKTFSMGLNLSF